MSFQKHREGAEQTQQSCRPEGKVVCLPSPSPSCSLAEEKEEFQAKMAAKRQSRKEATEEKRAKLKVVLASQRLIH